MKLVFATNNKHKIYEVKHLIKNEIEILSLKDINCNDDIPENENTLEGNSLAKAKWVFDKYGYNCFADDTGLEVEALNGEPGVYSARYAGEYGNNLANIKKLLENLKQKQNRKARFRTVVTLIIDNKIYTFEGIVTGTITDQMRGTEGFGYDPVFMPDGYDITFAEMPVDEKNKISHRSRAFLKLIDFLNKNFI